MEHHFRDFGHIWCAYEVTMYTLGHGESDVAIYPLYVYTIVFVFESFE